MFVEIRSRKLAIAAERCNVVVQALAAVRVGRCCGVARKVGSCCGGSGIGRDSCPACAGGASRGGLDGGDLL